MCVCKTECTEISLSFSPICNHSAFFAACDCVPYLAFSSNTVFFSFFSSLLHLLCACVCVHLQKFKSKRNTGSGKDASAIEFSFSNLFFAFSFAPSHTIFLMV